VYPDLERAARLPGFCAGCGGFGRIERGEKNRLFGSLPDFLVCPGADREGPDLRQRPGRLRGAFKSMDDQYGTDRQDDEDQEGGEQDGTRKSFHVAPRFGLVRAHSPPPVNSGA